MERYFKTVDGKYVNIVKHTLEQIEKYPNLQIYVGTDSQTMGGHTVYATTICFRYGTRGAHYVVFKEEVARVSDDFMRLWDEGRRTIETAAILTDELPVSVYLEFDYNDYAKTVSNKLVSSFKGYQNARFKSCEMIATRAANHECRNRSNLFKLEEVTLIAA